MTTSRDLIRAEIAQVLLWVGQPEIVLFKTSSAEYILALGEDTDESDSLFIGAAVTKAQLAEYQAEQFDLRYLMTHPALRRWYAIDLSDAGPEYALAPVKRDDPRIAACLPDSGLFARGHDAINGLDVISPTATETFDIDGSWDFDELRKFYNQVEDIYYMYNTIERYAAPSTNPDIRGAIVDSFVRPFRGGGSYRALYGSIANDNDPQATLRLSGVKYHSPGYIEVKARQGPFDEIIALLKSFSYNIDGARRQYGVLYKYLFNLGLLKAEPDTALSDSVREGLGVYTSSLAATLGNISYDVMRELSGGNELITAKVVLSLFRRTERLYTFFEQGRVSYEGLSIDPRDDMIADF